jgi:ligand-binding sensor domain-containing protein/signal transduction histidine kinase
MFLFLGWARCLRHRRWCIASLVALGSLLAFPSIGRAERLPVKSYTVADGLAHDRVLRIVRDSRGFLWFCTAGGLSRFDGRQFVSYAVEDGLPIQSLTHLLENADGSYWIATNGAGLVRYDPAASQVRDAVGSGAKSRFAVWSIGREPASNRVNVVYRDRTGRLWIGTDGGLFDAERDDPRPTFRRVSLNIASHPDRLLQVWSLFEDPHDGSLWIGTSAGLIRARDGRVILHHIRPSRGSDNVWALMIEPDGRLWIGHDAGLFTVASKERDRPDDERGTVWTAVSGPLTNTRVQSVLRASDGHVWAGTEAGLLEFVSGRVTEYGAAHGLEGISSYALNEDAYGNIWVGTAASGAVRIARDGLTTYTKIDGLDHDAVGMLLDTRSGQLCAVSRGSRLNIFDGQRFQTVVPKLPRDSDAGAESYYAVALHDHAGEWWIPSGDTLYRFPAVKNAASLATINPRAVYRVGEGLASRGIWRLYEDSRGNIWIARRVPSSEVLMRLEPAGGRLHRYAERDGLPPSAATTFAEDRSGNLWIGFWDAGLARYRNGRFETFSSADGMPPGGIAALHVDREGRLWCGSAHGLVRIDAPDADRPHLTRYSATDGLADNMVVTLTDDWRGNLYVGTRRGLDRLDPQSGRIRHFTTADGLPALETRAAYCDSHGVLWFSTARGLSRLLIRPDPPSLPLATFLQSVRIDGAPQPLPDVGASVVGPVKALSAASRIEIDFFAFAFDPGAALRFQYKLDGTDSWSPPTEARNVTYPQLAAGTYRFLVRGVSSDGRTSPTPASLTFTIPAPLWARWWFLTALASVMVLAVHAAYRYRISRLLEIERIRTGLAMDLHDDIGSTLSQVAVLSEVARARVQGDSRLTELIERIAEISRQLVDAMSDLVWATNPERDSVRDLQQRMRRFASDTLDAQNIRLRFDAPSDDLNVRLDPHVRRDVFLIFKETINNLRRYANCTRAEIEFQIRDSSLVLTIEDDGIGMDPAARDNGLGLRSMRERAERLSADLRFDSATGRGTVLRLVVPLRHQPFSHFRARSDSQTRRAGQLH